MDCGLVDCDAGSLAGGNQRFEGKENTAFWYAAPCSLVEVDRRCENLKAHISEENCASVM
jgi:hypothetical protein